MSKPSTFTQDSVEYTASNGRMRYSPEYHDNHGKPFTEDDLIYMCSMWDSMKKSDIAAALGKTHGTILNKAYLLRKSGLFDYYRKMG